ncbi:TadE/TadG family type IV pilus assembly protein [Gymnodinialimonas ulvae]|uniref:TadE/TadG family type IV pilus assembly protein n=1 Tax=Gymnodinialimonas ulvae TaxID=3126504 RepID=UPI00309A3EDB
MQITRHIKGFWRDEGGTATIEMVIMFPLMMLMFMAAFETALILTRQIMLERTLDMSVRVLRLAQGVVTDADAVRDTICSNTSMLPNCDTLLTIDLQVIDTTYEPPANDQICAERDTVNNVVIRPDNTFNQGGNNEFVLIRTCLVVDPILPFSGFGLSLARDDSGGMHMSASSIFVNEPS